MCVYPVESCECCKNFKIAITLNKLSLGINSILITGIISTITSSVLSHEFGSILLPL